MEKNMKIQILGPGCAKCTKLTETTVTAAKELGIEYELEKISDVNQIMAFGVMMTPGLVVNGEVKSVGKVPTLEEVKNMLGQKK
jgi:small redox-active disulfide protein 2